MPRLSADLVLPIRPQAADPLLTSVADDVRELNALLARGHELLARMAATAAHIRRQTADLGADGHVLLTQDEACARLGGISRPTLRKRFLQPGFIRTYRGISNSVLLRAADLEAAVDLLGDER